MNKERAAKSINVGQFMGLVKNSLVSISSQSASPVAASPSGAIPTPEDTAVCPASPLSPISLDEKIGKVQSALDTAIELYGQDRHVELGEYWPSFFALLEAYGITSDAASPTTKDDAKASSTAPSTAVSGEDAAEAAEEAALLEKGGADIPENAEATPPPAAAEEAKSSSSSSAPKAKRVITPADIEERERFNKGRFRYMSFPEDWEERSKSVTNPVTYLKHTVLYTESAQKAKEVSEILDDAEVCDRNTNKGSEKNAAKWTATSKIDAKGYGTYYRAIEGTPFHSLKVVGEVDSNVLSVLAVLCELDMYKEWFPMCWHSEEQGRVGDLHRYSLFTVSCPWPVASRGVFIGGFGCDCVYQKKIVIVAKSVDLERDFVPIECNIPPHQKGTVTATLTCGGFVIEPLKGGKTKVSFTMNVDPKLKVVPTSMINYFSAKLIWVLLKNLGSAAAKSEKKGSPYHIRREEQKELYNYFRERALQVLPPDFL